MCMLQALGVKDAQHWLRPHLESWNNEAWTHTEPGRCLRQLAHHWLNSWTENYKVRMRQIKRERDLLFKEFPRKLR